MRRDEPPRRKARQKRRWAGDLPLLDPPISLGVLGGLAVRSLSEKLPNRSVPLGRGTTRASRAPLRSAEGGGRASRGLDHLAGGALGAVVAPGRAADALRSRPARRQRRALRHGLRALVQHRRRDAARAAGARAAMPSSGSSQSWWRSPPSRRSRCSSSSPCRETALPRRPVGARPAWDDQRSNGSLSRGDGIAREPEAPLGNTGSGKREDDVSKPSLPPFPRSARR